MTITLPLLYIFIKLITFLPKSVNLFINLINFINKSKYYKIYINLSFINIIEINNEQINLLKKIEHIKILIGFESSTYT